MSLITEVSEKDLYKMAVEESVPFFKWAVWVEQTLNKQILH